MKKTHPIRNRVLATCMILTAFCVAFIRSANAVEDAIIAIVNDELITLKNLKEFLHSNYMELMTEGYSQEKIKEIMLDLEVNGINRLIEERLILSRANASKLEVNEKIIDKRLEEIKSKYPSEQVFTDALIKNGGTLTDLREKIKDQLKIQYIIDNDVRSKIRVNPQEVTDYYESNIEKFQRKERVSLESIFITFKEGKQKAREKAEEALQKINSGESFTEIAKQYSETPSIGTVERGQVLKEIETVIFDLKLNKVSDIVEVNNGFYIFKMTGRSDPETLPIIDVKEVITQHLEETKFQERLKKWIEGLKKEAYIEIKK